MSTRTTVVAGLIYLALRLEVASLPKKTFRFGIVLPPLLDRGKLRG